MNIQQAKDELKHYAIKSIWTDDKDCYVIIENCGRNFNGTRKFKAKKFETIISQIKKTFP